MKNLIPTVLILFLLCFGNSASAQQKTFDAAKLDQMFDVLESNQRMMGVVTLTKNGKTIYRRALGWRDVSGKEKNDFETKFRIGSIAKVFTAVMIYQLIEEKKLTLETKLSAFFPQIPNVDRISVAQMLSHRTGLANYPQGVDYNDPKAWVFEPQTSGKMLERFAALKPVFAPGEKYQYSNMNYTLLGYIVESLTKSTYAEQLDKRIVRKIGLKRTNFGGKINPAKNEARAYNFDESRWNLSVEQDLSVAGGSGGIVSTTGDLTKFVSALFAGKLLKPESLKEMTASPADNLRQNGKGIGNFEVLDTKRKGHSELEIDKTGLHQAFSRQVWQRRTNEKGFISVGKWKIYVEEGLLKTPVELIYWDGKLRAEYRQEKLVEYDCRWDEQNQRPRTIEKPQHSKTPYSSKQPELFEVGWNREPIEEVRAVRSSRSIFSEQIKLPFTEAA